MISLANPRAPIRCTLFALALLGTIPSAQASTYCVGSVQELQAALAAIESNACCDDPIDLRIRSGTYLLPAPASGGYALRFVNRFYGSDYRISGGWDATCSTQSRQTSLATQLDAQGLGGVLQVRHVETTLADPTPGQFPTLRIDNVRFSNGIVPFDGVPRPGCLGFASIGTNAPGEYPRPYALVVENAVFRQCSEAMNVGRSNATTIRNSLFVDNYGRWAAIDVASPDGPLSIVNNTFRRNEVIAANNPGAEVRIGRGDSPAQAKYVVNNVFADSVLTGAQANQLIGDGLSFVRNNRVQNVTGDAVAGYPFLSGNTIASPMFVGEFDHRLSAGSPLRDAGDNAAIGGVGTIDFAGAARVQGASVDISAYELAPQAAPDALFANAFE